MFLKVTLTLFQNGVCCYCLTSCKAHSPTQPYSVGTLAHGSPMSCWALRAYL